MANLTRAKLIEQIDYERRETNSKFISPIQTINLLTRATKRILREPGIRTLPALQNITAIANTSSYALPDNFKTLFSLWSGEGSASGVKFTYKSPDDFNNVVSGYFYTFITPGYIEIKFPDINSLPVSTLKLRYWSKDIILDVDGSTYKRIWDSDDDTSGLEEEFDDFYIEFCVANILRREGKAEWKDRLATAMEILSNLKESESTKSRGNSNSFGHYRFGNITN